MEERGDGMGGEIPGIVLSPSLSISWPAWNGHEMEDARERGARNADPGGRQLIRRRRKAD